MVKQAKELITSGKLDKDACDIVSKIVAELEDLMNQMDKKQVVGQ